MNCQNVRTAIDAASPREPFSETVTTHLAFCESCADYSAQMSALFALMSDVPRVQAPNDFDFRLRARIAQAKAAPAPRGGLSFFSELWQSSFSWGQMGSALAAITLVVTLSTVYLTRNNSSTPDDSGAIAKVNLPATSFTPSVSSVRNASGERQVNSLQVSVADNRNIKVERVSNRASQKGATVIVIPPVGDVDKPLPPPEDHNVVRAMVIDRRGRRTPVNELSYGIPAVVASADAAAPRLAQAIF